MGEIVRSHGCRAVVTEDWSGFGKRKQRALATATGTWIPFIDADGIVQETLARGTRAVIERAGHDGGWYPDRVVRLARRNAAPRALPPEAASSRPEAIRAPPDAEN